MWGKGYGKGGYGGSPYDGYGMEKGGYGGYGGGYGKSKGGGGEWGGDEEEPAPKKRRGGGGGRSGPGDGTITAASWHSEIPGFKEALTEAFQEAGLNKDTEDLEDIIKKCETAAQKQAKKFFNDERASTKMTAAQCRSFIGEFIEAVMSAWSNFLYDKDWSEKVAWNGALLMLTVNTFSNGKIFTRVLKSEITPFIDDGLLAWSEEDRIVKQMWKGLEAGGIQGKSGKKANQHLMKAYDDAHFLSPFGTTDPSSASLTPEVATLQEFVKGWMTLFYAKAYQAFESSIPDSSPQGQVASLSTMFQALMDPDSPCLPVTLQTVLPPAPWSYIEQCATEVIAESSAN